MAPQSCHFSLYFSSFSSSFIIYQISLLLALGQLFIHSPYVTAREHNEEDSEETKKETEEMNEKYTDLREFLEVQLEGKVQKVTVSTLLTDSPAALVQVNKASRQFCPYQQF